MGVLLRATATVGRDLDSLKDERAFEEAITARWLAGTPTEARHQLAQ